MDSYTGTVTRRDDGRWLARYRNAAGKEHVQTFTTKGAGKRWLIGKTAQIVTGTYADPARGRQQLHDFALEWAESQDWKETTRGDFPRVFARAERALPERVTLASIDELMLKRVRVDLKKKYAPATVDLTMTYLLAIMRAAYSTRRISHDPTTNARPKKRNRNERDRVGPEDVPTRAEVAAIWNGAPTTFRAAIALGATGLRVGEVVGLTADRVDVEQRLVTIDRQLQHIDGQLQFTKPKREKERTIRVPSAVAVELRRHLRARPKGLLFRGVRGAAMLRRDQFYASAWKPALAEAGLAGRFVFHSLRHFAASSMLAEGVNPMAVAGHLGDSLETLQRTYAHWLRDDRDVPADALDRILVIGDADFSRTSASRRD